MSTLIELMPEVADQEARNSAVVGVPVRRLHGTRPPVRLTLREREIADLLVRGFENAEIARELHIAVRTVKVHMSRIFLRYGITTGVKRVKLARILYEELCL